MASESVTIVCEREAQLVLQVRRLREDLSELQGVFDWLGALFGQLKEGPVRSAELAEMGQHLADDYSSTCGSMLRASEAMDSQAEEVRQAA